MGFQIESGGGNSDRAEVSVEGRLRTESVRLTPQFYASIKYGNAFQVNSGVQTVSSAGAYGLLALRNDGNDFLAITYIRIGVNKTEANETQAEILLGGTWSDGSAANLYNMDQKNSDVPAVTYHYNTLMSGANSIDVQWGTGPAEMVYNKEGSIILKPNAIISLKVTTGTDSVKVHGRISFYVISRSIAREI